MTVYDSILMSVRALQSFPHKIGADRICTTAWYQATGVSEAGGAVTVYPGAIGRPLPHSIRVRPTLAYGRYRLPYRALGDRAFALHDLIVSRRLRRAGGELDVVHTWPLAARETLLTARRLGIPTVLERPNAHTHFAYQAVADECRRLGVSLPPGHEHHYNNRRLAREKEEYELADVLLCPSDFVAQTFLDEGFSASALMRHTYGFDEQRYFAARRPANQDEGLNVLFVGVCAVRKGLHFALDAWLRSTASSRGTFRIAGAFVPDYAARLQPMLEHSSVRVLGHSDQVPELMRMSDILVLPSIEEGFALVCLEAMASGCVPLVSEACTEIVRHQQEGLRHRVGDTEALAEQFTSLDEHRELLDRLRSNCLTEAGHHTWARAGERLLTVYGQAASMA